MTQTNGVWGGGGAALDGYMANFVVLFGNCSGLFLYLNSIRGKEQLSEISTSQ